MDWQDVMIKEHGKGWGYKEYTCGDVFHFAEKIDELRNVIEALKLELLAMGYEEEDLLENFPYFTED